MLNIFLYACWPSVCLLWKNVYSSLQPIFWLDSLKFLILSCISCLCILDINLLLVISFTNIFSHSSSCFLFVCFVEGFLFCAKGKFNWVPFINFCFCFFWLRRRIQNSFMFPQKSHLPFQLLTLYHWLPLSQLCRILIRAQRRKMGSLWRM